MRATSTGLRLTRRLVPLRQRYRSYNFASARYDAAFSREGWPDAGAAFCAKLRSDTVAYIESFDASTWSSDPVTTVLKGQPLTAGTLETTVDAFGAENGSVVQATPAEVDAVLQHMREYTPPKKDYRAEVRAMEAEILDVAGRWPALLVGNQALDFKKQDGVTEIEESVEANTVERRLVDQLLADEAAGVVAVNRAPAYVACVSNFTNFLDLCRKGLRNLEMGVRTARPKWPSWERRSSPPRPLQMPPRASRLLFTPRRSRRAKKLALSG